MPLYLRNYDVRRVGAWLRAAIAIAISWIVKVGVMGQCFDSLYKIRILCYGGSFLAECDLAYLRGCDRKKCIK